MACSAKFISSSMNKKFLKYTKIKETGMCLLSSPVLQFFFLFFLFVTCFASDCILQIVPLLI